jgi:hypothetical protein
MVDDAAPDRGLGATARPELTALRLREAFALSVFPAACSRRPVPIRPVPIACSTAAYAPTIRRMATVEQAA